MILDDHEIFLDGLKLLLETSGLVDKVHAFSSTDNFLSSFPSVQPTLAIVDHHLHSNTGIEVLATLKNSYPMTKCVLISSLKDPKLAELSEKNHLDGFLHKSIPKTELVQSIASILNNQTVFIGSVNTTEAIFSNKSVNPFRNLSKRELEIVKYLARGFSQQEVADLMKLSIRTVETHRRSINEKTGKLSLTKLAHEAYLWGILDSNA